MSDVEAYAQQKGLQCEVEPNGALTTSMALVFMDHFSQESRQHEKWKQINYFINSRYAHLMTSPDFPTAYLICLNRQNA
ncbi:MAG: hypothetical protein IPK30_05220 [Cellvibrionales bacterium]|nr:hypothetical protein [Cellvibrionales bacterium]